MELYLLRHGIAEDTAKNGGGDSARELTSEGREKVSSVMRTASRGGMKPALIVSSPYARAMQTAKIAARDTEYSGKIVTLESLVPHGNPPSVWHDIRDYPDEPSILLAGHEPLMSALVAYLLGSPSLMVEMKKSALVRIDVSALRGTPHGILRWMLTPRHCDLLSKK